MSDDVKGLFPNLSKGIFANLSEKHQYSKRFYFFIYIFFCTVVGELTCMYSDIFNEFQQRSFVDVCVQAGLKRKI